MEKRRNFQLKKVDVDVSELISSLVELHQLKAGKPVCFHLDVTPENLSIRADRTHLSNMLGNLIDNAIKYSGEEADITITCRPDYVSVADRGIGISASQLPHIFERFYRVPTGNRHEVKGYGLGLFYVRTMAEQHGWNVHATSTPGKGTTVTLNFSEKTKQP